MDGRGPYGLACKVCYKAKSKCTKLPDGSGCERCHRLKKPCEPSDNLRRRNMVQHQSGQMEVLETRINQLTYILHAFQQQHGIPMPLELQMQLPMLMAPPPPPPAAVLPSSGAVPTPSPYEPFFQPSQEPPALIEEFKLVLPERDAEEALTIFRQHHAQFCPFVYLPPELSAEELKKDKPFLFEAILAVTARSMPEKQNRAKHIKRLAANEILIQNRSTLDLFIGLLTYIAWSHDHRVNTMNTLPRLMHLALSIMDSLHLYKAVPLGSHMMSELGGENLWPKIPRLGNKGYLEDKRALLACFLLNSYLSVYFSELGPMAWTPELEGALSAIKENPQWYGDRLLVAHVRMQLLVQNVKEAREQQETRLSIPFFTKTFRSQLRSIQKSFPPDIQKEEHIIGHIHYVELIIHETAFTADTRPPSDPDATPLNEEPIGVEAVDCMWHALLAIKAWLSSYDKIAPDDHVGFTIMTWAQMALALVTLHRLSTHPAPDWDKDAARKTVNVVDAISLIRDHIHQVVPKQDFPEDFWQQVGRQTEIIRNWIIKESGMEGTAEKTPMEQIANAIASCESPDSISDAPGEDEASEIVVPDIPKPGPAKVPKSSGPGRTSGSAHTGTSPTNGPGPARAHAHDSGSGPTHAPGPANTQVSLHSGMAHPAGQPNWTPMVSAWHGSENGFQPLPPLEAIHYPIQYGYGGWPSMGLPMNDPQGGMQY